MDQLCIDARLQQSDSSCLTPDIRRQPDWMGNAIEPQLELLRTRRLPFTRFKSSWLQCLGRLAPGPQCRDGPCYRKAETLTFHQSSALFLQRYYTLVVKNQMSLTSSQRGGNGDQFLK